MVKRSTKQTVQTQKPIVIRVSVTPSVLIPGSKGKAAVQVTVMDARAVPLAGVALQGRISPASLGEVSGLTKTNKKGESRGKWHAGREGGEGLLVVSAKSGRYRGEAAIKLEKIIRPEPVPPEPVPEPRPPEPAPEPVPEPVPPEPMPEPVPETAPPEPMPEPPGDRGKQNP